MHISTTRRCSRCLRLRSIQMFRPSTNKNSKDGVSVQCWRCQDYARKYRVRRYREHKAKGSQGPAGHVMSEPVCPDAEVVLHRLSGYALRTAIRTNGCTQDWVVLRCPFCGEQHRHGAGGLDSDPLTFLARLPGSPLSAQEGEGFRPRD